MLAALGHARAVAGGPTGQLRVGFTVTTPTEPLTRLVADFETRYPECRVIMQEHSLTGDGWDI